MSIRRRPAAKLSPLDTPHDVGRHPANSHTNAGGRKADKTSAQSLPHNRRPVALQAPRPKPMTNLTLEELLEIQPPCMKTVSAEVPDKATSQRVEEAKEALGKLECEIVTALFPSTGLPASIEEVAMRLGMTEKEVREVADNALRGLRGTKSSRSRLSTVWN